MDHDPEEAAEAKDGTPKSETRVGHWRLGNWIAEIIGGVIVLIIAGLVLGPLGLLGRDDQSSSSVTGTTNSVSHPPKTLTEEAARRSIWTSPPQTFKNASVAFLDGETTQVFDGDVAAFTPREMVEHGASLEGKSVFVVGRLVSIQERKTAIDNDDLASEGVQELRIKGGNSNFDAYVATSTLVGDDLTRGEVIFALGRIAAIGTTMDDRGKRMQSAYIFAFESAANLGLVSETTSGAIRASARGEKSYYFRTRNEKNGTQSPSVDDL